jgi:hypothetical protein
VAAAGAPFEDQGEPGPSGQVRWNTSQGVIVQVMCGFVADSLLSREHYCKKTSIRGDRRVSSLAIAHTLSQNHNLPCLPSTHQEKVLCFNMHVTDANMHVTAPSMHVTAPNMRLPMST